MTRYWIILATLVPSVYGDSAALGAMNEIAAGGHEISTSGPGVDLPQRAADNTPEPLRVVRGAYLQCATTTNIVVRWRTSLPTDSQVRFGRSVEDLSWQTGASEISTNHSVTLTNLAPNTRYFYSIGTQTAALQQSADHFFVTHPTQPKATRIWALGDCGTASAGGLFPENAKGVRDAYYRFVGSRPTDVWLLLGDNAYLSGTDEEYQVAIFDLYPEMLRKASAWPTIGNHDAPALIPSPYLDLFTLPTRGEAGGVASGTGRYYSFDYGDIHFVGLDSQTSVRTGGGAMLNWLRADLDANTKPWLIAFWHHPPYTKGSHNSDSELELIQMRTNAVPILEAYGVDLVLCGHSHSYERSYLLDGHYGKSTTLTANAVKDGGDGREDGTGPYIKTSRELAPHEGAVYVVAGSSGWVTAGYGLNHPAMCVSLPTRGSVVIDVDQQRLDLRFLTDADTVDDHFTLLKGESPGPLRFAQFRVNGETVAASWKSTAGFRYRIEATETLEAPSWQDVSGPVTATGATTFWQEQMSVHAGSSFFRVIELGPNL